MNRPGPEDLIQSISDRLTELWREAVPAGAGRAPVEDIQRILRSVIQNRLSQLDLVSREEFDAQAAVLQRSREKIDQLEQQLQVLSEQLEQR